MNKILSRTYSQRKRIFKSIFLSLCKQRRVVTFSARAKEASRVFEKMISKTKHYLNENNVLAANRELHKFFGSIAQTQLILKTIDACKNRNGGFLSVLKFDICTSNGSERSIIRFSDDK